MKLVPLLLALLVPATLTGQGPRHFTSPPAATDLPIGPALRDPVPQRHELALALAGAMGGFGGLVAGAYVGARIETAGGCSHEWCGWTGAILGAAIGTTVMIPAVVHLANDQRGDLIEGIASSVAALAGGIAISLLMQDPQPLLVVPVAQIIGAVATEKRTSADVRERP
jgi:hypothetical protein